MAKAFVHIELNTQDPANAKKFYGALFDWKLEDMPMPDGTYTMLKPSDGPGGGMFKPPPGGPTAWIPYVSVADVVASTKKVTELGGKVMVDNQEVPGMGRFSIIADPTGGILGLWQATR